MSRDALRIALLTHSTNPRGGVVHCLELADALMAQGHAVTVHAPGVPGQPLFRACRAAVRILPVPGSGRSLREVVQARIHSFVQGLSEAGRAEFDVFHAHDGIGANALLALRRQGLVGAYVRTVHHVDAGFGDPVVDAWETQSICQANRLVCVSESWAPKLRERFQRDAQVIHNGVDLRRFSTVPQPRDADLAQRLGLGPGPVYLMVGGIEARKNTVGALQAFIQLRARVPTAQLLIAGGASLLDHSPYRQRFEQLLAQSNLPTGPGQPVVLTGVLADADMPAVYRLATALLFPSFLEGFGLAIVEAMASGRPVIVSRQAPFTDFLGPDDALWVDPHSAPSMAEALLQVLFQGTARALSERGWQLARRFDWAAAARAHAELYAGQLQDAPRTPFQPTFC
ncbi:MSMEG_0565 family glycosyltransferase [Curvibacter sp. RS43]|uniref:MSMEG_0565 family glycosyltransferase n=1 Tax=Curvibacter microcysteis TaxID=3026419 RepID=UPI00235DF1A5|nr:MSMEG_0565 family glycosyltransferase [Curvibacter sp. RS43]MDD0809186.1 MSMEG_0565 family glycosyltransferase [Curvibacter sp. RS43]